MKQITRFQQRVYDAITRIPRGRVSTYQLVAKFLGCGAPRAVGQALRCNPYAPRVPCHRVIAADLKIGGFMGDVAGPAIRRKLRLLAAEGVRFRDGRLADAERIIDLREHGLRARAG